MDGITDHDIDSFALTYQAEGWPYYTAIEKAKALCEAWSNSVSKSDFEEDGDK